MSFQMVDRIKRLACCFCDGLARHQAHQQAADQPGAGGSSNGIDVGKGHARLLQRFFHERIQRLDMGPCGNFRHHTAIGAVFLELRQNDVGDDLAAPIRMPNHNGCSGFVTACLYAEDTKKGGHHICSFIAIMRGVGLRQLR